MKEGEKNNFCQNDHYDLTWHQNPELLTLGLNMKSLECICHLQNSLLFLLLQVISGMWAKLAGACSRLQPGKCTIIQRDSTHNVPKPCKTVQKMCNTHMIAIYGIPPVFIFYLFCRICETHVNSVTDIWIGQETNCRGTLVRAHLRAHISEGVFSFSQ